MSGTFFGTLFFIKSITAVDKYEIIYHNICLWANSSETSNIGM